MNIHIFNPLCASQVNFKSHDFNFLSMVVFLHARLLNAFFLINYVANLRVENGFCLLMMRKKRIVKKVANNATAFEVRLLSTTLNEKKSMVNVIFSKRKLNRLRRTLKQEEVRVEKIIFLENKFTAIKYTSRQTT
jgi:hypothetical protein